MPNTKKKTSFAQVEYDKNNGEYHALLGILDLAASVIKDMK